MSVRASKGMWLPKFWRGAKVRRDRARVATLAIAAACVLCCSFSTAAHAQQPDNTRGLARWGAQPSNIAAGAASKLAESPVLRQAHLDLDPAFIANIVQSPDHAWDIIGHINIRAFPDAELTLIPTRRHNEGLAGLTVIQCDVIHNGRSQQGAYALITPAFDEQQQRHILAAHIFTGGELGYLIRTDKQGELIIEEVDIARLPTCGNTEHERIVNNEVQPQIPGDGTRGFGDGNNVDVLVAYTPNALSHLGGSVASMNAQIANAVTDANLAYETSLINLRVFLAGEPLAVAASNPDLSLTTLNQLRTSNDGFYDEVIPRREQVAADIVVLMTGTNLNDCGRAFLMVTPSSSFESNAFAVVRIDCILNRTFVHELGHVMGCEHARPEATGSGSFPFSFGHRSTSGAWRTVMALPPGIRLNQFSNPNVLHLGEPTGIPQGGVNQADNATTINLNTFFIANFRSSTPPCPGTSPNNAQNLGSLPANIAGSTLGCGLQTNWTCASAGSTGNAAYFTFTLPGPIAGKITAVGENFPIRVQLFGSPSLASAPIACAQAASNQQAQINGLQLSAGITYMVAVGGQSPGQEGPFTLIVEADCPIDELTARVIPPLSRFETYTDFGDTSSCGNAFVQRCNDSPNSLLSFGPDVVYSYTPEIDSVLEINTCSNTTWNSVVFVHEDAIVLGQALFCDSNHTGCGNGHQARLMNAAFKEGRTYYIILDGESVPANPVSGGPYQLNVIDNTPCRGTACASAVVMDATIPSIKTMDTGCATGSAPVSTCNPGVTGSTRNAVWTQWTSPISGPVVLNVDPTIRVNYNAVAAIYTNTCSNPIQLACGSGSTPFNIPFTAQQGVTYRIQVGTKGATANSGPDRYSRLTIDIPQNCPCDRDSDGLQTIDDYFSYLTDFFAQLGGPGSADLTGDNLVTVDDIFIFLNCLPAMAAAQPCPTN